MCIQRFDRKKNRIEAAAETEKKSIVWFTPVHTAARRVFSLKISFKYRIAALKKQEI